MHGMVSKEKANFKLSWGYKSNPEKPEQFSHHGFFTTETDANLFIEKHILPHKGENDVDHVLEPISGENG